MRQALPGIIDAYAGALVFAVCRKYPVAASKGDNRIADADMNINNRAFMFADAVFKYIFNKSHEYQWRNIFAIGFAIYIKINVGIVADAQALQLNIIANAVYLALQGDKIGIYIIGYIAHNVW